MREKIHTEVGKAAARENIDVLNRGRKCKVYRRGGKDAVKTVVSFDGNDSAWEYLDKIMAKGDTVLLRLREE